MVLEVRDTCVMCAIKHLGQAYILGSEARLGYPEHYFIALAHIAEAEDELVREYPEFANKVRDERKAWEHDPFYKPRFILLIRELSSLAYADLDALLTSEKKEKIW